MTFQETIFDAANIWTPFLVETLGPRLVETREYAQITLAELAELAELIGIDVDEMREFESGDLIPHTEMIVKIARALDCSTDWLLLGTSEGRHSPRNKPQYAPDLPQLFGLWNHARLQSSDPMVSDEAAKPYHQVMAQIEEAASKIRAQSSADIAIKYLIVTTDRRPTEALGKSLTRDAKLALHAKRDEERILEILAQWQANLVTSDVTGMTDKEGDALYQMRHALELLAFEIPANTGKALAAKLVMLGDAIESFYPADAGLKRDIVRLLGSNLNIKL